MRRLLAIALVLAAAFPAGAAANARPDRSFGDKGSVTTRIAGASASGFGVAVTGSGKILVAGGSSAGQDQQIVVARYRANGRPDRSFGRRGVFQSSLPSKRGPYKAAAVVLEEGTGKPLIAGGFGEGSVLIARLTKDGRFDKSFGTGGKGYTTVPVGSIGQSLAVQPDGSLLVGSSNENDNGRPFTVTRFTPEGEVDATFGNGGTAEVLFWDPTAASSAGTSGLSVAANGTITGSGLVDNIGAGGHGSAGVFQLDSAGTPVQGFGTVGGGTQVAFQQADGTFDFWFPCAMALDSQGRIVIPGDGNSTAAGLMTARLTPTGALDPSFGAAGDGRARTTGPKGGNLTNCGTTVSPGGSVTVGIGAILTRLTAAGTPDTSFAPNGVLAVKDPKKVAIAALAPAGTDRVVVAGSAKNSLYVARFRVPAGA
jgi:uncharacterized delta-60 repeat protein